VFGTIFNASDVTYTKSLVNADLVYANFTKTAFQKVPIPHLTRSTMKSALSENMRSALIEIF
jgi:hypothetical protein